MESTSEKTLEYYRTNSKNAITLVLEITKYEEISDFVVIEKEGKAAESKKKKEDKEFENYVPFRSKELNKENTTLFFDEKPIDFAEEIVLPKGEHTLEIFFDTDITSAQNLLAANVYAKEIKVKIASTTLKDISHMFLLCPILQKIDVSKMCTTNVTNMEGLFSGCFLLRKVKFEEESSLLSSDSDGFINLDKQSSEKLSSDEDGFVSLKQSPFSTEKVTNMKGVFNNCQKLENFDLRCFLTYNATTMEEMFCGCLSAKSFNLSSFKTDKVTSMKSMFYRCGMKELDLHSFSNLSLKNAAFMFGGCVNLTKLDISGFDNKEISYDGVFDGCEKLKEIQSGLAKKKVSFSYDDYKEKVKKATKPSVEPPKIKEKSTPETNKSHNTWRTYKANNKSEYTGDRNVKAHSSSGYKRDSELEVLGNIFAGFITAMPNIAEFLLKTIAVVFVTGVTSLVGLTVGIGYLISK